MSLLLDRLLDGFLLSHCFPSVQCRGYGVRSPSALCYLLPSKVEGGDPVDVFFLPLLLAFILDVDNIQFEGMLERVGAIGSVWAKAWIMLTDRLTLASSAFAT